MFLNLIENLIHTRLNFQNFILNGKGNDIINVSESRLNSARFDIPQLDIIPHKFIVEIGTVY